MSPVDRSAWRNTYIYVSGNRDTVLGGLYAAEGTTKANLYSMLEVFCHFTDTFELYDDREQLLERDGQPLHPGNYFIVTNGSISVTDDVPLPCATSSPSEAGVSSFCDAVRERDQQCVITGRPARLAHFGSWIGFEAFHIFPLEHEQHWNDSKYGDWITIPPADESQGSINSVQNGILLGSHILDLFAFYDVTINPDDNYKIVCFSPASLSLHIAGRHLSQKFLSNPLRPVDQLLRWHFRQAVLINVKGNGEPWLEPELPPSPNSMNAVNEPSKSSGRVESEPFSCFDATGDRV